MHTYDIHNPTKAKRIFYDGIEGSQKRIELASGGHARVCLADHMANRLRGVLRVKRVGEEPVVTLPPPPGPMVATPVDQGQPKPIAHIIGHRGIGDNLHQRGPIRELMRQGYEVYVETPGWVLYHDLIEQGLKLIFMNTSLHAQARQIERERGTYQWHHKPHPKNIKLSKRIFYNKHEVDRDGSIIQAMYGACGLSIPSQPDFSMPVRPEWREEAKKLIASWPTGGKPVLVYRPITFRPEWNGSARNPDQSAYHALYASLRHRFFVVSIANLKPGVEMIVGDEQEADVKIHDGRLSTQELAGLWAESACVFANAGFGPVLAQAVGTPCITVYGGRESYRTTERGGAHLAPTLGIDPDKPCDCHSGAMKCGKCQKHITLPPAIERIENFLKEVVFRESKPIILRDLEIKPEQAVQPVPVLQRQEGGTLLFGTFYIDSPDRSNLTDLWIKLHSTLNPDCDLLAVDSQSTIKKFADWTPYGGTRAKRMYFNFPDNIGHLSRKGPTLGRDGWGRAFCKGLQIACDLGYDYVAHIEGDSLFRLNVKDITARMAQENAKCFSTGVHGMRIPGSNVGWVETGLMFFSTDYLRHSNFIEKYDWPNRRQAPTPEVVVRRMLGNDLVTQNQWRALRADKNQITDENVLSLGLDWVTHQHRSEHQGVYRLFAEAAMGSEGRHPEDNGKTMPLVSAPEAAKPLNKLNLGCGRNKLTGWQNHDAEVDITKPLPWPDNSASHIFIEHCVEHVTHKQAIEFFKQAYRVLAPGGVLRVTVPSLEQIRRCDEGDYHRFTQKWAGPHGATKRGAMHAIIFAHGHEMIWTAQLLEAALFYSGFDETEVCKPGESRHEPLREVEGHAREIGEKFNLIESCTVEAIKSGGIVAAAVPPSYKRAAIILGGADRWEDDYARAKEMCVRNGIQPELFYTNDHIAWLGEEGIAVTLHPDKLAKWMTIRRGRNHPPPHEIWAHRPSAKHGVTHSTEDWRGSSGLFGVACARKKGHTLILLCGIPMDANQNHFVRKAKWTACSAFQSGWRIKHADIAPYVRSLSGGFTEELLGAPTDEWINTTQGERKEAA